MINVAVTTVPAVGDPPLFFKTMYKLPSITFLFRVRELKSVSTTT